MANPPLENDLNLLRQANWKCLQTDLLEYAYFKTGRLKWRTSRDTLPRGLAPEDLVTGAIQKTYEGVRQWNPITTPSLLDFLKSVIDSDINHLVSSEEHRLTNYHAHSTQEDASEAIEGLTCANQANPEQFMLRRENDLQDVDFSAIFGELQQTFAHDRPVQIVLNSYREQSFKNQPIKPSAVVRDTGLEIGEVRNAIKRLRRRVG